MIEAYYYKAKIYFTFEKDIEMAIALKSLYKINPQYNFPLETNLIFLKKAQNIGGVLEREGKRKKNAWLLVAVGVVAVAAGVYFLTKKPKRTLTVSVGEGVEGNPVSGTSTYKKGASVSYNYTLKNGYSGLTVKLEGTAVDPSGAFKMDKDHTLTASAARTYTLTLVSDVLKMDK